MPRLGASEIAGALNAGSPGSDGSDGSDGPPPLAADFAADTTLAAGSLWKTCHAHTPLFERRLPRNIRRFFDQRHDLGRGVALEDLPGAHTNVWAQAPQEHMGAF